MTYTKWTATVQQDSDSDDLYIVFPPDLIEEMGWKENDQLNWTDNKDGTFSISKKTKTQWVLVETVSIFKHQYLVEVPAGKSEWALDTVTCNEANEASQIHLDEIITGHRVVTKEEAIKICDENNDYISSWSEETKIKALFTPWSNKKA